MVSFSAAIKEDLGLAAERDGRVWEYHKPAEPFSTIHRHYELEVNLVIQGTAAYLLEDRCYELKPNSLVWLFPEQNHILVDQSAAYRMWIAVFRPEIIVEFAPVLPAGL
ncbi:MAG TPA: AraC family ligand binding domain-containing protein [Chloroflexia bacterium]|nr:AraC family ligand binding domain-containing protein [Chloroflexia bacterium]